MKVDHDLDLRPNCTAQRLHQARDLVDLRQGRVEMGVGDEHRLERPIAAVEQLPRAQHERVGVGRLVHGPHVAEAEMRIDADLVAHLAAEQPPHRHAEVLPEDIPERHLDARDRARPDRPEPPERLLLHDPHGLFDVARITSDEQRRQILHGADDRARLPLQRGFAPAVKPWIVGLDAHEDPVPHLGIHDARAQARDLHRSPSLRLFKT